MKVQEKSIFLLTYNQITSLNHKTLKDINGQCNITSSHITLIISSSIQLKLL